MLTVPQKKTAFPSFSDRFAAFFICSVFYALFYALFYGFLKIIFL